jgi:hypothetical protein
MNSQSFSTTFRTRGKRMGICNRRQMKKRKSHETEFIDWILAIDLDPHQKSYILF